MVEDFVRWVERERVRESERVRERGTREEKVMRIISYGGKRVKIWFNALGGFFPNEEFT